MTHLTWNGELSTAIKKAAKSVAYQWPGVAEADDVEQAIWLHIMERPGTQRDLDDMDDLSRYRTVSKIGHRIASQERTDYAHYKGSYSYSVAEIKQLLKSGAIKEQELRAQDCTEELVTKGKAEPTTQIPVQVSDLRAALVKLADKNEEYAKAIIKRYRLDEYPESVKEKDALHNGVESLAKEMNRVRRVDHDNHHDGPGTRQIVGRETAIVLTSSQWDDDTYLSQREGVWDG